MTTEIEKEEENFPLDSLKLATVISLLVALMWVYNQHVAKRKWELKLNL